LKLQDVLDLKPELSLLKLKLLLIRKKKEGSFFYTETMSSLLAEEPFIMYNSLKKLPSQNNKVFPVLRSSALLNLSENQLKSIFQEYHQIKDIPSDVDFASFSVYKGKKWLWYWVG
jgi:hypothetical protein